MNLNLNLNSIDVSRVVNYIKSILNTEYLSELTQASFKYVSNLMGIVVRYPKEVILKRLQKRKRKPLTACVRRNKRCGSKCRCTKCTKKADKKSRVIESDFFANLAYEHRLSKANEIPKAKDARIRNPCCVKEEDHRNVAIHRDVQIAITAGWSWWTNFTCRRYMPPMYPPCEFETRSECSSHTSGYKSNIQDEESYTESVELHKNTSEILNDSSDDRSVVELAVINRNAQSRSKSDQLVVLRRPKVKKIKKLVRSASAKATHLKKKKRNRRLFNVRRRRNKQKKERKVVKKPSFSNLSTVVCCSQTGPS